ncbi:TMEM175 family protein [Kitasatospora sp. NBC_01287]|uniref:TMEM175 family protein n=1 Tax=Kitasatospora sp. NBC_01287 TaxID=2903573 RepID=UPI002252AE36|nr:TMEM175 family protein [Kitasatospora sp. NBC_01287]MCX4748310.1 TMEM175 family protein [Kitasatospora sp. NBC_01287]
MNPIRHHHHDQQREAAPEPMEISTGRLEAFSDGVFAIAITLLVLDFQLPSGNGPLLDRLAHEWPALGAYVVSFLIIGVVWMNHHTMLHYIRRVDRVLLLFNLVLLMNVSFIPFPTHVLANALSSGHGERTAAVFYGLTLTLGGIPFNAVWIYASAGHRHLGKHITPAQALVLRKHFIMGPFMYLAATLVGLISAVASMTIFGVLLLFYMIEVLGTSSSASHPHEEQPRSPVQLLTAVAEPPPADAAGSAPAPAPEPAAQPTPRPVPRQPEQPPADQPVCEHCGHPRDEEAEPAPAH